jgi:hypothetical protein
MRFFFTIISVFLFAFPALGQTSSEANKNSQAKEELRKLFVELNEAFQKRDRKALERIYAEEFIWVHSVGYVDDRTTHINDSLTIETRTPLLIPTFDQLFIYGDVAISRSQNQTRAANSLFGTSIFVKRDGRWQIVQTQGTLMLPERKIVEVDLKILDSYVGRYENDAKESLTITREGKSLVVALQRPNVPKRLLISTSDVQFFDKLGSEYAFRKGEDGKVTHFDYRLNNREAKWKKVE